MGGPAVSKESDKGIIIRVAKQLCQYIEKSRRKGTAFPNPHSLTIHATLFKNNKIWERLDMITKSLDHT